MFNKFQKLLKVSITISQQKLSFLTIQYWLLNIRFDCKAEFRSGSQLDELDHKRVSASQLCWHSQRGAFIILVNISGMYHQVCRYPNVDSSQPPVGEGEWLLFQVMTGWKVLHTAKQFWVTPVLRGRPGDVFHEESGHLHPAPEQASEWSLTPHQTQ